MDRLIALVLLRWKLEWRVLHGTRERALALAVTLPMTLLVAMGFALMAFFGVRFLQGQQPEHLPALASLAATALAGLWMLAPLLTGLAVTDTHDVSRLTHFPLPPRLLVSASILANLLQPMVLAELPMVLALSVALAEHAWAWPLTLFGVLLTLGTLLAGAQLAGLGFQLLARRRRLWDFALFLGLGAGLLLSLLPFLLLASGGRVVRGLWGLIVLNDRLAFSPFGFGLRAAVHAGRGEFGAFALHGLLGIVSLLALVGLAGLLLQRIATGELALGSGRSTSTRAARQWLPGRLGALIEKDLRLAWREPAMKAALVFGLLGPALFLYFASRWRQGPAGETSVLMLASFIGVSGFGANAFGLERRGLALLFSFAIPRWQVFVGKNVVALLFRLPGLLTLTIAAMVMAPVALLPAAATIAFVTLAVASGLDNFMSIWFPIVAPAPGKNPFGAGSGTRGLGAAMISGLLLLGVLVLSSPFVFLAWFPLLYGETRYWLVTLPLALLGAACVYALLVAGAAGQLTRREPELLARVLGED